MAVTKIEDLIDKARAGDVGAAAGAIDKLREAGMDAVADRSFDDWPRRVADAVEAHLMALRIPAKIMAVRLDSVPVLAAGAASMREQLDGVESFLDERLGEGATTLLGARGVRGPCRFCGRNN
jgi:hypothetical protein